jgi:uncharacterized protein YcbX
MFVKELWRYPVKSLRGERVAEARITAEGIEGDRLVVVRGVHGRVLTSRTHPKLLGLTGSTDAAGVPLIDGHRWDSPEALALVQAATGQEAAVVWHTEGNKRFDILPLLVATDGAIAHMGFDSRRFRPNILVGAVPGLTERGWQRKRLRVAEALLYMAQLRDRCVMTTYDPDTLQQDPTVLRRVVDELDGSMALDTSVVSGGVVREGDAVELVED